MWNIGRTNETLATALQYTAFILHWDSYVGMSEAEPWHHIIIVVYKVLGLNMWGTNLKSDDQDIHPFCDNLMSIVSVADTPGGC